MLVYSANIYEPVGKITREGILKDYNVPSVLWGIDGDWMVNFIEAKIPFYPQWKSISHYQYPMQRQIPCLILRKSSCERTPVSCYNCCRHPPYTILCNCQIRFLQSYIPKYVSIYCHNKSDNRGNICNP